MRKLMETDKADKVAALFPCSLSVLRSVDLWAPVA